MGGARLPTRAAAWRTAATIAMDARWHLYALIVGWECGGAEGRAIADAACAAMGRAESVVRAELEAAGAVMPQPQAQVAEAGAGDSDAAAGQTLIATASADASGAAGVDDGGGDEAGAAGGAKFIFRLELRAAGGALMVPFGRASPAEERHRVRIAAHRSNSGARRVARGARRAAEPAHPRAAARVLREAYESMRCRVRYWLLWQSWPSVAPCQCSMQTRLYY